MNGPWSFPRQEKYLGRELLHGSPVDTGHWQAIKGVPQTKTIELQNVLIEVGISETVQVLQELIEPNLPWAEDHFQERVGGVPLNPGEQYKNWPWYRGNVDTHRKFTCPNCETEFDGHQKVGYPCPVCGEELPAFDTREPQFSHTYMERFWSKFAGEQFEGFQTNEDGGPWGGNRGIRYDYGDLNDVVSLLAREPYTRQAILPVFFPEDTGAHHGERIPCSLYYHFVLRNGRLHCNYTIRSCDFLRHFRDDVYMAARLCQWVLERVQDEVPSATTKQDIWHEVKPGKLTMMMHSLHIFEGDLPKMRRLYG